MAWTNIPSTDVDQDSPVTQTLMTALRDNAQWAWECTWHPYDAAYPGDGNDGVFYDFAVDGTSTSVDTPDFEDGFEYRVRIYDLRLTPTTGTLTVAPYFETNAAYESAKNIGTIGNSAESSLEVYIQTPRVDKSEHFISFVGGNGDTALGPSAFGFRDATPQSVLNLRFTTSSVDTAEGMMILERRRVTNSVASS